MSVRLNFRTRNKTKQNSIFDSLYFKVIHLELYKKLKFDHTNKWYIHNLASVLENMIHNLLWDFDIQTDRLISARRPDLIIINNNNKKRTCKIGERAWKEENEWRPSKLLHY